MADTLPTLPAITPYYSRRSAMVKKQPDSYEPDMAAMIDRPDEIIADEYGVNLAVARRIIADRENLARRGQAQILASVIGQLIQSRNINLQVHALAIAFGMDQLNGAHSQSEIAKELGVTRALVSHYVLAWRDVLAGAIGAFDNLTFRKRDSTRETYRQSATDPVLEAKRKLRAKIQAKRKK
jgi:hypothetical protein